MNSSRNHLPVIHFVFEDCNILKTGQDHSKPKPNSTIFSQLEEGNCKTILSQTMLDKDVQECPNCKELFPCSITLKVHSQEHALPNVKQIISDKSKRDNVGPTSSNQLLCISYDCYICHSTFSSRENLVQHSNIHLLGHSCQSAECKQLLHGEKSSTDNTIQVIDKMQDSNDSNRQTQNSIPYQRPSENNADNKKRINTKCKLRMTSSSDSIKTVVNCTANKNKSNSNSHHRSNPASKTLNIVQSKSASASSSQNQVKRKCYQCKTCQKILSSKISYIEHNRIHTGERPYKCILCAKSYAVKNTFRQHMAVHNNSEQISDPYHRESKGNKVYKCSICFDNFPTPEKLDYHICPTNKRGESFRCKICGRMFAHRDWRTRHYLSSHNNGESCFRCEICGEIFPNEQFYLIHAQIHFSREIKKGFLDCRVCGKTFPGKDLYERHSCRFAAVSSR